MISASRARSGARARARPPRQARSTVTYRRLLDAAETLLETQSFDAVSVAEIARQAGVTTGAFYARFADKDALLEALEVRVTETVLERLRRVSGKSALDGQTLADALHRYFAALVDAYVTTRGAGRALVLRSHTDGKLRGRLERLNSEGPPRIIGRLLAEGAVKHPKPKQGVELALLAIRSTLRETILFQEPRLNGDVVAPDILVEELTRLFVRYLGLDGRTRLSFPGGSKGR
jgi:AcrR family transcriptional regulator